MPPGAVATEWHRHCDRPPGQAAALGDEHRLAAGLGPLVDLDPDVGGGLLGEAPLLRVPGQLDAAVVEQHRRPGDRVGDRAHHLGETALGEHQPLEQRVDLDAALERLVALVDQPRRRPLGDRDERQLEGQLEQRQRRAPPPLRSARAAARRGRGRRASPRPAASLPASRRTNFRCRAAVFRLMPVVSSSSPPDRNGVGSSSSEMWTQRIGRSPARPRRRARGRTRRGGCGRRAWFRGSGPARRSYSAAPCPRPPRAPIAGPSPISWNCSLPQVSGGASWMTGSPRSSARQISPRR